MNGVGNQNALTLFGWNREIDVFRADFSAVQNEIFAFTRLDLKLRADAGFVHDLIRIDARGVDDPTGMNITPIGADADHTAALEEEVLEFRFEEHLNTIHDRVFSRSHGNLERVAHAAGACP